VARSWGLTLLIALAAGPWAVAGALFNGGQSLSGVLMLTVVGPLTEELMKVAGVVLVVERWPYAFRSTAQILLCCVAGGLAFAAIENLLYIHVYVAHPTPRFVMWRWTVCVALHTACSLIAGLGAVRVWRELWRKRSPPRLSLAFPFLIAATITHGLYNATAYVLELIGALTW
jgi:RsiW-degrading membrane proteinase PrsW (M82 family)